jgi:hypothetical protein
LNNASVNSVSAKSVEAKPAIGIADEAILEVIESSTENSVMPSVLDGLDALFDAAKIIDFNPHNSVVTMRKTAIELGGLGFKVFPIHYLTQTRGAWECSCCEWERWSAKKEGDPNREIACSNKPGKHPRSKWKETATDDADEIKELWSKRHKAANIAIATGQPSGVYVIDLDGKVGMDSLRELEAKHGELPKTLMAFSGRGDGLHLYFKAPAEEEGLTISAGTIGTGIDTRGSGGFIVAPGSNHNSLRRYMWVPGYGPGEIKPADLPEWFIEAMRQASNKTAEQKAAEKAAKAGKGSSGEKSEKREASDPFDVFAMAADDMLSGGWMIKDGEELDGVDAYVARIGEESDGYDGFHGPIYRALCSFFYHNGIDASVDEAKALLVPAILNAPCKDGRNAKRYSKDRYLDESVEEAREFIRERKQAEEKAKVAAIDRISAAVDKIGSHTTGKELDQLLAEIATIDMPLVKRNEIVGKIAKAFGTTKAKIESAMRKAKEQSDKRAATKKREVERRQTNTKAASGDVTAKPKLLVGIDDFDDMVKKAWLRLSVVNKAKPQYFEAGSVKVRVKENGGGVESEELDEDALWAELNEHVTWAVPRGDGDERIVDADTRVVKQILNQKNLHFPRLDGYATMPFFSASGDLVSKPGYHAPSHLYYHPPKDFVLPEIPAEPTEAEMLAARDLILDNVLIDFPFRDGEDDNGDSSRCHAMAMLLQPFMRPMIAGCTPIYFVVKPAAGTGASLLIKSLTNISTGEPAATNTEKEGLEEQRKALTSFLLTGAPVYLLDNINKHFHGAAYANLVTVDVWADRLLGSNKNAKVPVRCQTIIAGNNVAMSGECARRCLPIPLDAERDPLKRVLFKHNLDKYIPENRAALVKACLTLIRYWIMKGQPEWRGNPLKSFEDFSRKMGGLLEAIGMSGFLGNLDVAEEAADAEIGPWAAFVGAIYETYGSQPRKIGCPFDNGSGSAGEFDGDNSLITLIEKKGIAGIAIKGESPNSKMASLGAQMVHRKNKVFKVGDRDLRLCSDKRAGREQFWYVKEVKIDPFQKAAEDIYVSTGDWDDG